MKRLPLFVLLLLGTACGGADRSDHFSAADAVEAAAKTLDRGSCRFAFAISTKGYRQPGGSLTGSGITNYTSHGLVRLDDVYSPALRWTVLIDGDDVYMRFPPSGTFAGMRPWVKLVPFGQDNVDLQHLRRQIGNDDPSHFLQFVRGTTGPVVVQGRDEVHGILSTHYRAKIDLSKVVALADPDVRGKLEDPVSSLIASIGSSVLPIDVWIGTDGLVRRLEFRLRARASSSTFFKFSSDYYDFGVPVHLKPPAKKDVISERDFYLSGPRK